MQDSYSQQIGERAERSFEASRPISQELAVRLNQISKDFGIDYFVQYSINYKVQDLSFLIQLKGIGKKLTENKTGKGKGLLSFELENEEYKRFLITHKYPISLIVVDNLDSNAGHSIYFCSKIDEDDLKITVYIDPKDKLTDTDSWLHFIDQVREANLLVSQKNVEEQDKLNFIRGFRDKIKSQRVELENGYYAIRTDNGWATKHIDNKLLKFTVSLSPTDSEINSSLKEGVLPLDGEFDVIEDVILETGTKILKGSKFRYQSGSLVKLKIKNRMTRQFLIIDSNLFVLNPDYNDFKYRIKSLPYETVKIELIFGENVVINFDDDPFFFEGGSYDLFVILNDNTEMEIFSFNAPQN